MINISNISNQLPYIKFAKLYNEALAAKQQNIEAICISSFDDKNKESNSRFVNLKYIINDEWIFFYNYMGPKGSEFKINPNISAAFFWQQTNTQIRVKAQISKSSSEFSDDHFKKRDKEKNILAISSNQSKKIDTYEDFLDVFEQASKVISDTTKRPDHWGGYSFRPYYFEFWQGHSKRINKREGYILKGDNWENFFLQP